MTPPPPAVPGLPTGHREKRRRAPVSDRPADSPGSRRGTSLPWQGELLSRNVNDTVVEALFFVGVDWAAVSHAVCVLDERGRRVTAFTIDHTAAGFDQLLRRLARLGDPGRTPVAIERPDGRLVDA